MALVLKELSKFYKHLVLDLGDPRSLEYPLMKSPVQIVFLLTVYVIFVKIIGPELMKNRKPYNLKYIIAAFNLFQILYNGYIAYLGTKVLLRIDNKFCILIDYGFSQETLRIHYFQGMYFYMKVSDLLDTVFFVLRKKFNQISFLHVYHHTMMVFSVWVMFRYFSGGQSLYTGIFNCYVHAAMYSYYFLSTIDERYKNNLFIKKNITRLQLLQFFLNYVFFVPMIFMPDCKYPKSLLLLFLPQNTLMVLLFSDFYYKTYIKKKQKIACN